MPSFSTDGIEAPLASLVILTYNQERYIAEAIEAALAQDYENFEVVISDDGSSDATYDIARSIAASYCGPCRIVVNQTASNRGTLKHFYEAVRLCRGDLIIGAAGDDVSMPHRVSRLMERRQQTGADALFSSWIIINEAGSCLGEGKPLTVWDPDPQDYFPGRKIKQVTGMTAAYTRRTFEAIEPPAGLVYSEDFFLGLMVNLCSGHVEFIDEPLVQYRLHSGALVNRSSENSSLEEYERKGATFARSSITLLEHFQEAARTGKFIAPGYGYRAKIDLKAVSRDIRYQQYRATWIDASFGRRLRALVEARSLQRLRWLLPRTFGLSGLRLIRSMFAR